MIHFKQTLFMWDFRFSRWRVWRWEPSDIAPCSLVEVDRRFRGAYFLHQGDDGGSTHLWNVGLLQRDYTAL